MLRSHLRVLALDFSVSPSHPLRTNLLLHALHLAGLIAICRLAHWPLWLAPLLLAAFCVPQLVRRRWWVESLAPLSVMYGLALLRLGIVYGLERTVPPALGYAWGAAISGIWTALIVLKALLRLWYAWLVLALSAAALMVYLLYLNRPAGITASDPFVYMQMALDLAQHGTLQHLFPLAPFAASLGLPTLPTTHVGYVLPNAEGFAPSVWPPGYSVLLAGAYRLGGQELIPVVNLAIGVLCLASTFSLAALICPGRWHYLPVSVGAGAWTVVATSPEQFTRLVVPLADGAAQMLTALAVYCTLRAVRMSRAHSHTHALTGTLAGLSLAAAYSVRYTQALIAPGIILIAWLVLRDSKTRLAFLLAFVLAALLGAAPDAWYRAQLYGAPWRFGTGELAHFTFRAAPEALARLGRQLFSFREFGWLWPAALAGAGYAWRRNRHAILGLVAIYGPLVAFHLFYPFVRLRDLLSLYPPLAALCAVGGAALLIRLWSRGTAVRLTLVAGLIGLGALRLVPLWGFQYGFFTFGYLLPEQRAALDSLATRTEPGAVIACSLNSGAVELYAQRATVRPGNLLQPGLGWNAEQWLIFVAALREQGRPLYLLMDSPEMNAPLAAVEELYTLAPVGALDVPVYFAGGSSQNLTVPLYRLEPES